MKQMLPFTPHLAHECLELLNCKNFNDWPNIDKKNILHATMAAMHRALDKLSVVPSNIVVDGNYFKMYSDKDDSIIPHQLIKGGDNKYRNIAAASILSISVQGIPSISSKTSILEVDKSQ